MYFSEPVDAENQAVMQVSSHKGRGFTNILKSLSLINANKILKVWTLSSRFCFILQEKGHSSIWTIQIPSKNPDLKQFFSKTPLADRLHEPQLAVPLLPCLTLTTMYFSEAMQPSPAGFWSVDGKCLACVALEWNAGCAWTRYCSRAASERHSPSSCSLEPGNLSATSSKVQQPPATWSDALDQKVQHARALQHRRQTH